MKHKFLLTLIAFIVSFGAVKAVEKTPYQWEVLTINVYPEGWTHIEDEADFDGVKRTMSYTTKSMQYIGSDSFTALVAPSQTLFKSDFDQSEYKTVNDYLVSPALKGEVSMYVKRFSAMDEGAHKISSVKLFPANQNADGTFTVDTDNEIQTNFDDILPLMRNDSEYHKLEANLGDDYKNVAFRFDYVNVVNLCAESAWWPDKRSVKLNKVLLSPASQNITINADSQGNASLKSMFYVKNDGDVVLNEDDPEYYGMLALMVNDKEYTQSVKGKLPTLEPNQEGTAEIEFTFDVSDLTPDNNGKIKVRIDGFVWLDGKEQQTYIGSGYAATINIIPYKGILAIKYNNKDYNPGTAEKPTYIDLGTFSGSKSCEVMLNNSGSAPLVITAVDAPEGVAFDKLAQLPLTIEPGTANQVTETITINGDYLVEGPIALTFDGAGTNTIYVKGVAIPEGIAFYDFDDGQLPSSWFTFENNEGKWEIVSNPDSSDKNNKKSLRHYKKDYPSSATTGRIHFENGEKLHIDVALISTYAGGELKVRKSADRNEWTDVAEFGSDGFYFPTKSSTWQSYEVEMPEGDWYIDFYGSYLYIDNVYGGKEAPAMVDILPVSVTVGNTAMVNYPLTVTSTLRNMGQDLAGYQINLIADDEVVAEMEDEELISLSEKNYTISYYPHAVGEKEIKLALVTEDGELITLDKLTVDVEEESASLEVQVGESKGTKEDVPLSINYYNSRSEYVYTSDQLGTGACSISGIAYDYYKTMIADPKITKTQIWMQNTDDSEVGDAYTSTDDMVLVYEFDGNPSLKNGGSLNDFLRMSFELDTPFEYKGGNLRVAIESHSDHYCRTYFSYDNSDSPILYSADDKLDEFNAKAPTSANFMPVTYFTTVKEPVIVTGTVTAGVAKSADGNGVHGVEIKAMAKDADVQYVTQTLEDGTYSLPIIQADKEYKIVATHEEYKDADSQDVNFTNPVHNFLLEKLSTGIEEIEEGVTEDAVYFNLHGIKVENPTSGIYIRVSNGKTKKVAVK